MDAVKGSARRPYRSPLREESAHRTRRAVVLAAAELFTTRGYAATSLADVATAAGVARPTVFAAFGSKAALLREVLDQAISGDDDPVAVRDRPWFQPVWQARTAAETLDAYAGVVTLIAGRAAAAFEAVRRAADAAPEAAQLWETALRNRVAGARMVLDHLVTVGALRAGLDFERAVDILWLLNDPAHYGALVGYQGWSEPEFRSWLSAQMCAALLD
ncbi:MAG: TetR/AcrR family transcriptional regulator [Kineosporiaceae bacterium]